MPLSQWSNCLCGGLSLSKSKLTQDFEEPELTSSPNMHAAMCSCHPLTLPASMSCCHSCRLLEGESGVAPITRFDATSFPTNFAAQIKNFDSEG